MILEKAPVRAAAVSALAEIGHRVESLRKSIVVLLRRCVSDEDDEVRERAHLFVRLLEEDTTEDA